MSKIFISYRRLDSEDVTGRIYDYLARNFGKNSVFKDVDSIRLGTDFRAAVDSALQACAVVLVVIGKDWVDARNSNGRRIDDADDFVRLEIESALERNITIVPILVRGAEMPRDHELPESLRPLSFINALRIRADPDFKRDVERLLHALRRIVNFRRVFDASLLRVLALAIASLVATGVGYGFLIQRPLNQKVETDRAFIGAGKANPGAAVSLEIPSIPSAVNPLPSKPEAEQATTRARSQVVSPTKIDTEVPANVPAEVVLQASDEPKTETFRDPLKDGTDGPLMVVIPAGQFMMGSAANEKGRRNNEGPQHKVRIRRFALAKFELTWDEYVRFYQATGYGYRMPINRSGVGGTPALEVYFDYAEAYVKWLSEQTGKDYRLPSEAEWEYAARAGTTTPFSTGHCLTFDQANFEDRQDRAYADCLSTGRLLQRPVLVGAYASNRFGLKDMHGNAREWVADCYHPDYSDAPIDGSAWSGAANCFRILRGGSYTRPALEARSAHRVGKYNGYSTTDPIGEDGNFSADLGFRVARTL